MRHLAFVILPLAVLSLVAPAAAQIMVVGSSVQERATDPGESYLGQIRLRNQGSGPVAVRVYQTDYTFLADGTNLYPDPASVTRSNADWITAAPTDVVIPAGEETDITYEVAVPDDPALTGTYWSMIMVQPVPSAAEAEAMEGGVGLRTTVRFGIQVATHVAAEPPHALRLEGARVATDEVGARRMVFELFNSGEMAYRPAVSVEIYDTAGVLVWSGEYQRGLVYPGTSALQLVPLDDLPAGRYQASVVIDTGSLDVFGGQFFLTLDPAN